MVIRISDKTQNYSKVTKLLVKPKYNVRQFNLKSKEPFHLSFSIGIAKYNRNIDTFLSAMDDSMYEAKNMHRLMQ